MRGINCRGSRLVLFAGLMIALAAPQLAYAAGTSTTTTLTAPSSGLSGCTQTLSVNVLAGGTAVTSGTVTINDQFNGNAYQLGSATLNSNGEANSTVSLVTGTHSLSASYIGNSTNSGSTSTAASVSVTASCDLMPAASNLTPATSPVNTLTAGQSGTATVSVIPLPGFAATLTAPMFVTLSCSGLPDGATCSFTPENVEILSTTTGALTSTMVIQTYAASTAKATPPTTRSNPITWAFLLPGTLTLGGLAFGARRRRWLSRLSLLALVGLVTILGATACNPRYYYLNHGPPTNPATPAGSYTLKVIAQSGNGVTAVTLPTTFALTVQ